ncbi:hypothetical protein WJX75_005284 [Coccomyxa subellipsoidea]|uniref:RING-type domain-containing protein n=1 Tax=Coccomyxa subellipsoidea TaxID=248742 RepID=A0ABR2YJF0_9CHLO
MTLLASESCGHVFHEDCVAKALEYKKECPICRAPTKRPERDKRAEQHRIYLPLAPQSAPGLSQNPDTVATPGRLIVTRGEYSAKISEAEELRKEVKELHATIKEEARKLEAATAALQEETKKLRVMELEADELRDKAEEERLRLAEDVLVKERELKKLRDEKHTMKSQLEQQANFYKGKAVREERENKKHVKEVATLQLLLDKELGSKDLSAIAKKLGASSKDEDATLAFQNAIDLRNAEYRQLLLQKKKLDSERRDLALKAAVQPASSVQELSGGAAARSGALGSGQQHSGDSLGTSSFLSNRDSGSSRWKQSFSHASSSLGLGVGKGRGSFLHKKPPGSGGPNGQFVCRGADGKGGRTTVLKTASLLQTGMKRAAWPAASTYGSGAARSDSHMKTKSEKARTVQGTASIAQFFSKGPKS